MTAIADIFASDDFCIVNAQRRWTDIRRALLACRDERRPYLFGVPDSLRTIMVPVSRLEEEVYKAEIITYLARKTGAKIILLQAKDYGSRARVNTEKIISRIRRVSEAAKVTIPYDVELAHSDSDHLMREAAIRADQIGADLILLTASREYGLDDWLFGPQELWAIRRTAIPVMLVNPRDDLFSLCD